ncbi:MAG: hypothetical protein JW999_09670 [Methanotrichaceae archaeon]|nr:hypothetical protein [Methanotrichaceae archaeon]
MLETKGRVDIYVHLKIRAADAWVACVLHSSLEWSFVYVPQVVFANIDESRLETLESLCEPSKQRLIQEKIEAPLSLEKGNLEKLTTDEFIAEKELNRFSPKCKKRIQEAIPSSHSWKTRALSYAAVFTPLLGSIDEAAKAFIISEEDSYRE